MSAHEQGGDKPAVPDDLFITDELAARPPRRYHPELEIAAMRLIAGRMASSPQDLLPAFVRLAMDVTDAAASGLALLHEDDPDLLVWRHLCGSMELFENRVSPRIRATATAPLQGGEAILVAHPERVYGWAAAEAGLSFPEALVVPLHVAGDYVGTLWVGSSAAGHFDSGDARLLTELSRFAGIALEVIRREAGLRQTLEQQEIVASEMGHRLKNVFAIADGMVRATAKRAATPDSMADALTGRLHALERAHALLRLNISASPPSVVSTDLRRLLEEITNPLEGPAADAAPLFVFAGPPVSCGEHGTNGLALVFHELATNAFKHGGLSRPGGQVRVGWSVQGDQLAIRWSESGGPEISGPPDARGLGSSLVERSVSTQFAGSLDRKWNPEGLILDLRLSMRRVAI